MNNLLTSLKRKAGGKVFRLFLLLAVLMPVQLSGQPALAQPRQFDMELRLVPNRAGFIEVEPGKENLLFLEVNNIGANDLTDIKLSSDKADGWAIKFDPPVIESLAAGSIQTFNVSIFPPRDESSTSGASRLTRPVEPFPQVALPPGGISGEQESVNIIAEAKELRKVENFTLTLSVARLSLQLLSSSGTGFRSEVRAGRENSFVLEVSNIGNKEVTNIRFSSDTAGWTVSFDPGQIDSLAAGSSRTVKISISPPAKATTEDNEVNIIADATETRQALSFFFTVKPAQVWLWVWGAVGVALVGLFVFIYVKFGRQ